MNTIYLIKDGTDGNSFKPFVAIAKSKTSADYVVEQRRQKVPTYAQKLIQYEPMKVDDFDPNKTHVYVIFDKSDGKNKSFDMRFDFQNAEQLVRSKKAKLPHYAQKLVFTRMEKLI